jgi:hypothetical protein
VRSRGILREAVVLMDIDDGFDIFVIVMAGLMTWSGTEMMAHPGPVQPFILGTLATGAGVLIAIARAVSSVLRYRRRCAASAVWPRSEDLPEDL